MIETSLLRRLALALCLLVAFIPAGLQAQVATVAQEHIIRAGDLLRIRVWPDDSLGGEFQVEVSGDVFLPEVGKVHAEGLPLSQLQKNIRDLYSSLMNQPVVSVTPLFPVVVIGGVLTPGRYTADPTMTVMDVVAKAGGFSERADPEHVRVVRGTQVIELNAEQALRLGMSAPIGLESGDQVVVPIRKRINWPAAIQLVQLVATTLLLIKQFK